MTGAGGGLRGRRGVAARGDVGHTAALGRVGGEQTGLGGGRGLRVRGLDAGLLISDNLGVTPVKTGVRGGRGGRAATRRCAHGMQQGKRGDLSFLYRRNGSARRQSLWRGNRT